MKKMNVHEADASISQESLPSVDRFSSLNKGSSQDLNRDEFIEEEEEEEEEETHVIEIWSKAAIGYYLWQHILQGDIKRNIQNGMYVFGSKKISNLKFKFRSGPSLTIESLRRVCHRISNRILNQFYEEEQKKNSPLRTKISF